MDERVKYVETLLGDSADNHAEHAALPKRFDYLEKLLGDSADKLSQEMQALRDAHAKFAAAHGEHVKDLDGLKALHARQGTVGERIDYLEEALGDSLEERACSRKRAFSEEDRAYDSGKYNGKQLESTGLGIVRQLRHDRALAVEIISSAETVLLAPERLIHVSLQDRVRLLEEEMLDRNKALGIYRGGDTLNERLDGVRAEVLILRHLWLKMKDEWG